MKGTGHAEDCQFVSYGGPTCNCDSTQGDHAVACEARRRIVQSMQVQGWQLEARNDPPSSLHFARRMGDHVVLVTRLIDGWQFHWFKRQLVIAESRGFATVEECLEGFWKAIGDTWDALREALVAALKEAK